MKVVLFGGSGMVGQGVLRECLRDARVDSILSVGRSGCGQQAEKLSELLEANLFDLTSLAPRLTGFDACFFCLGTSSVGKKEPEYRHVTYDLTVAVAGTLSRLNPAMTFVYVSGAGTDTTETGRTMWARVKGQTENALLRLPFKASYMFRPGIIQPLAGFHSKTLAYRVGYVLAWPFIPIIHALFPNSITTTERVGRAMIRVASEGAPTPFIETREINRLGA